MQKEKVFNGMKVFSATKAKERELLGEMITDWIRSHPGVEILDKIVTQSSDEAFHCLTITLFYFEDLAIKKATNHDQETAPRPPTSRIPVENPSARMVPGRG